MHHSICASLLLAMALLASPAQQSADRYIERARQWIKDGSYDDAERQLKRALEIKPDSAEANLLMAVVFRYKGQREVAIKYAEEALKHQPVFADAHYLLAVLLFERDTEAAFKEVETALAQGAVSVNIHILKANLLLIKRRYRAAIESLEQALNLMKPDEAERLKRYIEDLKNYAEFRENSPEASADDPTIQRPRLLNRPRPGYTGEARKLKIRGTVNIVARISEQGEVSNVVVLLSLGYGLDEEAEKAVRQMKFSPATKEGKPIPFWTPIQVEFNLRD
ncbi:MAG: TonB family protein [Acidobacteriota bacterium]